MGLRTYRLWDNTTVWGVLSVEVLPAVNTMSERYGRFYVHAKGSWRWFRVEKGRWFMWNEITQDGRYVNEEPWVLIEKQR
jgi:hypothetical protein